MSRHLSNFEQSVKNSLEGANIPYESSDWEALENRLNTIDANNSAKKNIRWAIAAGLLFALGTFYLYVNNNTESQVSQQIIENSDHNSAIEKAVQSKTDQIQEIENENVEATIESDENPESQNKTQPENKKSIQLKNKPSLTKAKQTTTTSVQTKAKEKTNPNSVSFTPSTKRACAGTEISFDVNTTDVNGSYLWNFGDGNFSNEEKPSNIYTKPGIYSITLAVTSNKDGVIKSNTKPVLITIDPRPIADFDWQFVSEYNDVPTIKITNQSLNATESEWTVNNKKESNEINLIKEFKNKGEYLVGLTVINEDGCSDTKYKTIHIENDYNLLAPKTFSPNNDGRNDTFLPSSLRVLGKEFELSIYHNEKLVYKTKDANKAWDGTLPNGSKAKANEKFPWVVILYDTNGNKQYYSGIVTVVP